MADVTLTGTVSHHFAKGIRVQETGDYGNRYTVWTEERIPIGSNVKVTGRLGVKATEKDGKHYVDLSVNFPRVEVEGQAPNPGTNTRQTGAHGQQGAYQAAGVDNWGTVNDNDAPF